MLLCSRLQIVNHLFYHIKAKQQQYLIVTLAFKHFLANVTSLVPEEMASLGIYMMGGLKLTNPTCKFCCTEQRGVTQADFWTYKLGFLYNHSHTVLV